MNTANNQTSQATTWNSIVKQNQTRI